MRSSTAAAKSSAQGSPEKPSEEEAVLEHPLCRHTNCGCTVDDDAAGGFCDAYCAAARHEDQPASGACACGHAACNARQEEATHASTEREIKISIGSGQ